MRTRASYADVRGARFLTDRDKEARGVLVAAFQSEREEETRD